MSKTSKTKCNPFRRIDPSSAEEKRRRRLELKLRVAERRVAKGRPARAIRCYQAMVREDPGDLGLLNRLGDLLARGHRSDDALELFLKIAGAFSRRGFLRRAMAIYGKILRLDPGHPVARSRRRELGVALGLPRELVYG